MTEVRQVITYGLQKSNIYVNPRTKSIEIPEPIDGQLLYSALKEAWKDDDTLIKYSFPMLPIIQDVYSFVDGWEPIDIESKHNIRLCAWRIIEGDWIKEEWALFNLACHDEILPECIYYRWHRGGSWDKLGPRAVVHKDYSRYYTVVFSLRICGSDVEFFIHQGNYITKIDNIKEMIGVTKIQVHHYVIPVAFEELLDWEY